MTKEKMLCPECLKIFTKKNEKNTIRNNNNSRVYFCSVNCKDVYLDRKKKMKNLGF